MRPGLAFAALGLLGCSESPTFGSGLFILEGLPEAEMSLFIVLELQVPVRMRGF